MAGIITILAALVPFGVWLWQRHDAKVDDPKNQQKKRYETIDSDLAKGDSLAATEHASLDLDELERLRLAKSH
jgi:hypothetical protein